MRDFLTYKPDKFFRWRRVCFLQAVREYPLPAYSPTVLFKKINRLSKVQWQSFVRRSLSSLKQTRSVIVILRTYCIWGIGYKIVSFKKIPLLILQSL